MKATIKSKNIIADNTLYVEFQLATEFKFQAGQWFIVELTNPPHQDERGSSRHFTIVNPPEDNQIIAMATRLSDSAFKQSLNELPLGTEIEISGPLGEFLLPPEKTDLVMIAGGIGITPFISQLRHIKNQKLSYKIKLLYFNRNQAATAFFKDLNDLASDISNLELAFIMSDDANWTGETGNISQVLIAKYSANLTDPIYMVVGPPKMVEAATTELKKLNLPDNRIKIETFTGY